MKISDMNLTLGFVVIFIILEYQTCTAIFNTIIQDIFDLYDDDSSSSYDDDSSSSSESNVNKQKISCINGVCTIYHPDYVIISTMGADGVNGQRPSVLTQNTPSFIELPPNYAITIQNAHNSVHQQVQPAHIKPSVVSGPSFAMPSVVQNPHNNIHHPQTPPQVQPLTVSQPPLVKPSIQQPPAQAQPSTILQPPLTNPMEVHTFNNSQQSQIPIQTQPPTVLQPPVDTKPMVDTIPSAPQIQPSAENPPITPTDT